MCLRPAEEKAPLKSAHWPRVCTAASQKRSPVLTVVAASLHLVTIPGAGCFAQAWNYPNPLKYTAANEDTGKKAIIVTVTHGARPDTSLIAC